MNKENEDSYSISMHALLLYIRGLEKRVTKLEEAGAKRTEQNTPASREFDHSDPWDPNPRGYHELHRKGE